MKKGLFSKAALIATAILGACGNASAYYYYLHLTSSGAIRDKWDVSSLPNKTVRFFVAEPGQETLNNATVAVPTLYSADSYEAVLSEIRGAGAVWDGVATSDLRISYGGLFTDDNNHNQDSGIDVQFSDDIPPGLLALAGHTVATTPVTKGGETFYPITGAQLFLPRDMSANLSWGEQFLTTVVHEFGHTVGLQHSTTSSAMATYVTSAASRAAPLLDDDTAAISMLYPTADFATNFGARTATVTGHVTFSSGSATNLAAVVAVSSSGSAVGTLTLPDGSYRIDGIPVPAKGSGYYYVYVQPLPGPLLGEKTNLNVVYPVAADGKTPVPPNGDFYVSFYPGTNNWRLATPIPLSAGVVHGAVDFTVQPRSSMAVDSIRTYGFVPGSTKYVSPNGVVVTSPPVTLGGAQQSIVLAGNGLMDSNGRFNNGVGFDVLGFGLQIVPGHARTYKDPNNGYYYAAIDVSANFFNSPGWRHLIVKSADDLYLLPAALRVVSAAAPAITGVSARPDGTIAITGSALSKLTRFSFDGLTVLPQSVAADGTVIAAPPPADPGYVSHLTALNPDGQSSYYLQGYGGSKTTWYTYPGSAAPSLAVTNGTLAAGADTTMTVSGTNTNFVDGQTVVGFGTSNVTVKQVQVVSPTVLVVIATAAPGTKIPTTSINVTTGLSTIFGQSVVGQ